MDDRSYSLKKAFFKRRLGIAEHQEFKILQAAIEMIRKGGLDSLRFTDLARKIKISRKLIHYYFHTHEDLNRSLVSLTTLDLKMYVEEALASKKIGSDFEIYCRATLDWPANRPAAACAFLSLIHASAYSASVKNKNDSLSLTGRQKIQLLLSKAGVSKNLVEKSQSIQSLLMGGVLNQITEALSPAESQSLRNSCVKACMELSGASQR